MTVNGHLSYILHCEADGHIFYEKYLKPDAEKLIGKTVTVYVDRDDSAKCVADTSET